MTRSKIHVQPARQACNGLSPVSLGPLCARSSWPIGNRVLRVVPVVLLLVGGACRQDGRITLVELREKERALAEVEPVAVQHEALALTELKPYRVQPGDILEVRLTGLEAERYRPTDLQLRVHGDGSIRLPVVGAIDVAGLTLAEVEEKIIDAHVPSVVKDLAVYAELAAPENTTVMVMGAARQPGLVALEANERNVLYALALASGFNEGASGRVRVKPIRPEREEVVYNLNDINDVRRAMLGPPLESGDVLVVEGAAQSAIYVSGLVTQPGPIPVPPGSELSVLRAIAAAGGTRPYLDIKEASLVRELPSGEQVHVRLELGEMLAGVTPDLALRPGDILQVPHTADTLVQEWVLNNILVGPFSVQLRYDPLQQYNTERALEADNTGSNLSDAIRSSLSTSIPNLLVPTVQPPQ